MKRLALLRKENDISQLEFATRVGLSQQTISRYESGEREPDYDTLKKFASYFGVTTDYLLGLSDVRNPYDVNTIAAHHDGEEYSEEELQAIEDFKAMVLRLRREQKGK